MPVTRPTHRTSIHRRRVTALGVLTLTMAAAHLLVAVPAAAAGYTGGLSPTVVGGLADLNGDGVIDGSDDANAFYGDTHIIDGFLDCDAWTAPNDGAAGDGAIDTSDDCTLIGVDGTDNGVTIDVVDGEFQVGDGPLPAVFNAAEPDNADVSDSNFAWSAIGGRVDANGNEVVDGEDCHFGVIGEAEDAGLGDPTDGADILGSDASCGFGTPPDPADNGHVDLNSDGVITGADSCGDGCFLGFDVLEGVVQAVECPGHLGDPRNHVVGTAGPDVLTGTAGADLICGLGANDVLVGRRGNDLLLGGSGSDLVKAGPGNDRLVGGEGEDRLRGAAGRDDLFGGLRADLLRGGRGRDELFAGPGNDDLFGGAGDDRLDGGPGRNDLCVGGSGADTIVRCEQQQQ